MQGRDLTTDERELETARLTTLALQLIDMEGVSALSLRRLATLAQISRGKPYTYFANKEALLDAVRTAALHQIADGCEGALTASTVEARLKAVGASYLQFAFAHPHLYDLIFDTPASGEAHRQAIDRYRTLAEAPLVEAAALGMIRWSPERVARVLWAGTHGLIGLQRSGKLDVPFEQVVQDLGDMLAFGFVPRKSS